MGPRPSTRCEFWSKDRLHRDADIETTRTPSSRCDADRVIEFHAILHPFFTLATTWPGLKTNGSNNQFLCRQQHWSSEEREDLSWRGSNENRVMYGDSREKRDVVAFSNVARSTFPLSVRLSLILSVGSRRILIFCLGIP